MKNNGKRILKFFGIVCILIIISVFVEYFMFNFKQFNLKDNEKGIVEINNYTITKVNKKKCINIILDNLYVNKLLINYNSDVDIPVTIKYKELDYYGNQKTTEINDKIDNEVNVLVNNLSNRISEFEISYDDDLELGINNISIDNSFKINFLRIIYIFSFLLIILLLLNFYKKGGKTELLHKYFIVIAFLIGVTFIIIQPSSTFYSWDDQIHFLNTYELIGGDISWSVGEFSMVDGNAVGRDSIDSIEEQINQSKYLNMKKGADYNTYGSRFITYNKIAYVPSAIGYHLCDKVGLPFVVCFKVGKIMNLLSYVLIMGYAIKISKVGKRLLTVIGLLPSMIFLASQYSCDPAVMSGITLGMVVLINWFVDKDSKVDFKSMFIFIFAILYGSFPKAVYIPFILLFLFVPKERFYNKKYCNLMKFGIIIICLLVLYTFISPASLSSNIGGDNRGGNTNTGEQLKLIISHPIGYAKVLKDTFVEHFFSRVIGTDTLGRFAYIGGISSNFYYLTLIILLFVGFTDTDKKRMQIHHRLFTIATTIGIMLLIWTALYLSFTPVGLNTINGVQSRYFIPLLFPIILAFQSSKIKNNISEKNYNCIIFSIMSLILVISIYMLVLKVYCF